MATITTGIYRHLKDRSRSTDEKLRIVRLVWKAKRIFLQNKEQVLIDFLSGLIFNKKRLKLSEVDVKNVWGTLCDLLQTHTSTKVIIIKPSICQVINDNINHRSDHHSYAVQCCLNLLKSPSLSHVYNKFEPMVILLSNLLNFIVKSTDQYNDDGQWSLLQVVISKYLQVQRCHPNQKLVFQTVTDKLVVPILLLWSDTRVHSDTTLFTDLMKVLSNSLFNKEHTSSYSLFLHSINPDSTDKAQPPKHIENFFKTLFGCLGCQTEQNGISSEKLRLAVLRFVPVYFEKFLTSIKVSDYTTVKDLFVYLCKILGVNLLVSKDSERIPEELHCQADVLEVIGKLLMTTYDMDLYDKSHDPVYRHLIQVLINSDRSKGYFTCLMSLLKLNHLIVESKLEKILQQSSEEIQDEEGLDQFMVELVKLYSKLRQMDRFINKLTVVILNGTDQPHCLLTEGFYIRFKEEIEMLPQGTAVEIWQTFIQNIEDHFLCDLTESKRETACKFESYVQLLTMYMTSVKLFDYSVTDVNKKKVKDIIVTMGNQQSKLVEICVHAQKKITKIIYPVMLLMKTWGDVYLLMCQYTQLTNIYITEPVNHPHCVSAVYYFLSNTMTEKLYKMSSNTRRLQYLWDSMLVQTLKALWIANINKGHILEHFPRLPSNILASSWNQKISDINESSFAVARWKLLTDNFVLFSNELTIKQVEEYASFITDTLINNVEVGRDVTLRSITSLFIKDSTVIENKRLVTALITDVWSKMEHCVKCPKKISKDELRNVFCTLGDKAWLQKDVSFLENVNLNEIMKKALLISKNKVNFREDKSAVYIEKVFSVLPLPFLEPIDQARCFIGLLVVCFHGNVVMKHGCFPLLTKLLESSSSILRITDLNVFFNALFDLYVQQMDKNLMKETKLFVTTCFKSVCKEGYLLEKAQTFVNKLNEEIAVTEETVKRNDVIVRQQEQALQLTSLFIQQISQIINRPYVREDILALCKNYVEVLAAPVSNLLCAVRKSSNQGPVLPAVTQMYAVLVKQSQTMMSEGKKSQRNYEYLVQWSLKQLHVDKSEISVDRMKCVFKFLKEACSLSDNYQLTKEIKTSVLDTSFALLQRSYFSSENLRKSTCDLCEELLTLISTVIVSCDVSHFKDLVYKLEHAVNVDLSTTKSEDLSVCLGIWSHLLSCSMSEEQGSCFIQSVYNLTGYLTSLSQQLSSRNEVCGIEKQICDLQHKIMLMCPLTKQMILTILGSVLLIPVTMETFPTMYEILNEALLNHVNTVFDIIPVFLGCSKNLLFWLIKEGDQDVLTKTPEKTTDLIGCVHMIDRLFTLISTHKEEFCKPVVYVVADYVDHVHQHTLLPVVKKALVSAIYKLLDISDRHILAQLHTVLNQGVREVFKGLYDDYNNFYKYTGKV